MIRVCICVLYSLSCEPFLMQVCKHLILLLTCILKYEIKVLIIALLKRHCNRTAEECQSSAQQPRGGSLQHRVFIIPNFLKWRQSTSVGLFYNRIYFLQFMFIWCYEHINAQYLFLLSEWNAFISINISSDIPTGYVGYFLLRLPTNCFCNDNRGAYYVLRYKSDFIILCFYSLYSVRSHCPTGRVNGQITPLPPPGEFTTHCWHILP